MLINKCLKSLEMAQKNKYMRAIVNECDLETRWASIPVNFRQGAPRG